MKDEVEYVNLLLLHYRRVQLDTQNLHKFHKISETVNGQKTYTRYTYEKRLSYLIYKNRREGKLPDK